MTVRPRAGPWLATAFYVLSAVAVTAACFSDWFAWHHVADVDDQQRTGLGLLLASLDYSAVASYSTATPADADLVRYVGWPARAVVAWVLVATLIGLSRIWALTISPWLRAVLAPALAYVTVFGLLMLAWMLVAAGFSDIDYVSIEAGSRVRLARVLPWGPVFLAVAVLLQVAAGRVVRRATDMRASAPAGR